MVHSCCIKNCKTTWIPESGISFHKFPAENKELIAKWLENIPKHLLSSLKKSHVICSNHFENKCYEIGSLFRGRLRKNAVPTIFEDPLSKDEEDSDSEIRTRIQESLKQVVYNDLHEADNIAIINESNAVVEEKNRYSTKLSKTKKTIDTAVQVNNQNFWQRKKNIGVQVDSFQSFKRRSKNIGVQVRNRYWFQLSKIKLLQKRNRILQQRLKRRTKRLQSMKSLLACLIRNS